MNPDIIIIGGGMVGGMVAKYLKKQGLSTMIIDSKETYAASKCSFGLWKDGWINDSIRDMAMDGMDLLEEVCDGIETVEVWDMKRDEIMEMSKVDCGLITNESISYLRVKKIQNNKVFIDSILDKSEYIANKAVIIAAGAYTDELLIKSNYTDIHWLNKYWGATLRVNIQIDSHRIKEWAPYKQNVLVKVDEQNFTFGDGASVKNPLLNDKRIEKTSNRLLQHLTDVSGLTDFGKIKAVDEGWRPYLPKGNDQYIKQHDEKLFSITGGAKNTTILCGYFAKKIFELIKNV
jgi:hypothetical protein